MAADGRIRNAAEGDHGSARAFGTEAGERLRVAALTERGDGQQFGGGHDTLSAAAVDTHLKGFHVDSLPTGDCPAQGQTSSKEMTLCSPCAIRRPSE